MYREIFIKDFSTLGRVISEHIDGVYYNSLLDTAIERSESDNCFFSRYMQVEALRAIAVNFLNEDLLRKWLADYDISSVGTTEKNSEWSVRNVGIIMAGNIPLAGFHDLMSVLAAGCRAVVKPSSKDSRLIKAVAGILTEINGFWRNKILFVDRLSSGCIERLIASGRSETMERVKAEFGDIPMLLRGSRFSVAVIKGDEDADSLRKLGADIFLYFGLGCRSVSVLLVPEGYDFAVLTESLKGYFGITDTEDYRAVYKYAKVQAIMERAWFVDGVFFIFRNELPLPPPLAVVAIEYYKSNTDIEQFVGLNGHRLQCILNYEFNGRNIKFGNAQLPGVDEYADGVDTIEWLFRATL